MFSIKMNARYIVHGGKIRLKKAYYEQALTASGFAVCLLSAAGIVTGKENFLFRYFPFSPVVMTVLTIAAGLSFLFFHSAARLYFLSFIYYLSDASFSSPAGFMRVSAVLKFSACRFLVRGVKLLWSVLFFSPSALLLVLVLRTFAVRGAMTEVMLYTLIAAAVLLFTAGLAFYLFVCGRFLLWELLFIRNPRQSIREILKTSVGLSGKKTLSFTFLCVRKCFYFTLLGKTVCALRLEDAFSEKKYYLGLTSLKPLYQSIPRAF